MVDLSVEIGGVRFKNPIVVGSATPTMDSIRMKHGIDGGAGAIIAKSLLYKMRCVPSKLFLRCD
jgi:dihydropyrimidine dehydrogenase (NAD+) subunit PreA